MFNSHCDWQQALFVYSDSSVNPKLLAPADSYLISCYFGWSSRLYLPIKVSLYCGMFFKKNEHI